MPYSISSALFSEPEEFETAMRLEGWLSMLVTARGQFRARLTRLSLSEIRLTAVEEQLPRIAFVAVPSETVLILFSIGRSTALVCGGNAIEAGMVLARRPGALFPGRPDHH